MPKDNHHSVIDHVSGYVQKVVDETVEDTLNLADRAQKAMGKPRRNKQK